METPTRIQQRIEHNRVTQEKILDLRGEGLSTVPPEIRELMHLEQVWLGENAIQSLPNWLNDLPALQFIQLNGNPLREVGTVKNLVLDLQVWWRLQPAPDQVAGLRLRWKEGEMLEAALALPDLRWLDLGQDSLWIVPRRLWDCASLQVLYLNNNQILKLPPEIAELQNLSTLSLKNNQLSTLPLEILQLHNLSTLDLSSNAFSMLIPEIIELHGLSTLNLKYNKLSELPPKILQLHKLSRLDLRDNQLSRLPPEIGQLCNLSTLDLSFNRLITLPPEIGQLQNLSILKLRGNRISTLPPEIGQLHNLYTLNLDYNRLEVLPPEIGQPQNLSILNLEHNQFSVLTPEIAQLSNLHTLNLQNNPLEIPPLESLDLDKNGHVNITKLRAYFRQADEQGLDYIYEAKLLIVGEGGAGKTSLAKRIVDANAELPKTEEFTRGIDISQWIFSCQQKTTETTSPTERDFRVNIWDFGGQQIYHATHQFFLTKRSLYVLVADTRKENTNFYDWLNRVEVLSENSPVFIVKNHKIDRPPVELDEGSLRERFLTLDRIFNCNLSTNENREALLKYIRDRIQELPHIGQALPKTWIKVREALEADLRNYMSLDEYLELCQQHGFKVREDALQLSDYLHDLGVCLHFQDDDLLNKIVILKPTWGTDAVYKVLDSDKVQYGRFNKVDLKHIWQEDKYADRRAELLHLMMQFKLCYALPDEQHYIAPQLLSKEKPTYDWSTQNNLQLRYIYPRFMPKGILTRFIVAIHPFIEQHRQCVWQHGVVLSNDHSRAEIREDIERREIRLRISGQHKRDLLAYLVGKFEEIHKTLHNLEYQQLIPCNCSQCITRQDPNFYRYDVLKRYRDRGKTTIECQESFQDVNVRGLLDDIGDTPAMQHYTHQANRTLVYAELTQLLPAQFKSVCFQYGMPAEWLSNGAAQTIQSTEIVQYAEQRDGNLQRLLETIWEIKGKN